MRAVQRFALFVVLILGGLWAGCSDPPVGEVIVQIPDPIERDLDEIQARDTLVVLTQYNSTSYFLYRGEPMGFEFELLDWFARANDLYLQPLVVRDRDSLLVLLNQGVGDVVAARLSATAEDSVWVGFTRPLYRTNPVVVQREAPLEEADVPPELNSLIDSVAGAAPPETELQDAARGAVIRPAAPGDPVTVRARLVTRPGDLAGREVHVLEGTRIEDRLLELSDGLTGDIHVVEVDSGSVEMLIREVAEETINFTVGHENVAELQESYYSNLVIYPTVDDPYEVSLAVRRNAPDLWQALNAWIEENPGLRANLYRKYFEDRRGYRERVSDEYLTSETGVLSPYDSLFRQHAPIVGWDWRLLASQAFQESRFDPRARSWAGAMGLLQLMPATAREVNVADPYDPVENVEGAARYLIWLTSVWEDEIPDPGERLKFILASYNAGAGHVGDARRLAKKYGGDPNDWESVAYWLLRKSERSVYRDPVVRYGFCRGLEPVTYVAKILDRFAHYSQFVDPEATPLISDPPVEAP
ncbi:MAG: transglycosylase SLT domain-containing protein [Rhodothermales bacterium]|nr:transglycosylase SLT domain-containing protein [Rhodothermales bacterium]MBO6778931.1 transglycosylase SLT domain-containing protein [Rhodothermales bacterium]